MDAGAVSRAQTGGPLLTRQLLYQLSYNGRYKNTGIAAGVIKKYAPAGFDSVRILLAHCVSTPRQTFPQPGTGWGRLPDSNRRIKGFTALCPTAELKRHRSGIAAGGLEPYTHDRPFPCWFRVG